MAKLVSGRVKRKSQTGLTTDRYQFLGLDQAEPNLGDPLVGLSSVGANPIKPGKVYQLVSVDEYPGERFWSPIAESYWVRNNVGIHTTSKVGIGTTNPITTLHMVNSDPTKDSVLSIQHDPLNVAESGTVYNPRSVIAFTENPPGDLALAAIWYGNRPQANNFTRNDNSLILADFQKNSNNPNFGGVWFATPGRNLPTSTLDLNVINGSEYSKVQIQAGVSALGNFAVGTENPTSKLHVVGETNLDGINISSGIITSFVGIVTYYGDGSKLTGINAVTSSDSYWVKNDSGIHTTSNIGIKTDSFQHALSVNGNVGIASSIYDSTGSSGNLNNVLTSASGGIEWKALSFLLGGSWNDKIGVRTDNVTYTNTSNSLIWVSSTVGLSTTDGFTTQQLAGTYAIAYVDTIEVARSRDNGADNANDVFINTGFFVPQNSTYEVKLFTFDGSQQTSSVKIFAWSEFEFG